MAMHNAIKIGELTKSSDLKGFCNPFGDDA